MVEETGRKEVKVTKAQKRRDKKVDQAREREKMIEEQEKALNIYIFYFYSILF